MKKTDSRRDPATGLGRALPNDACPGCGTTLRERRGRLRLPVNGEEISVPSASHLGCPECGEIVLRFDDARRLAEDGFSLYRKKHGLLSADEIRAFRARLGLTQGGLARLLRLGANTVSGHLRPQARGRGRMVVKP